MPRSNSCFALAPEDQSAAKHIEFASHCVNGAREALKNARVKCRLCDVKLLNRHGLIGDLCPVCFEEKCSQCGTTIVMADGSLMEGFEISTGGSWLCPSCCAPAKGRGPR